MDRFENIGGDGFGENFISALEWIDAVDQINIELIDVNQFLTLEAALAAVRHHCALCPDRLTAWHCEGITEPPALSHPITRGRAGPSLLAMILASKFLLLKPLNRLSET
jgi:transposase